MIVHRDQRHGTPNPCKAGLVVTGPWLATVTSSATGSIVVVIAATSTTVTSSTPSHDTELRYSLQQVMLGNRRSKAIAFSSTPIIKDQSISNCLLDDYLYKVSNGRKLHRGDTSACPYPAFHMYVSQHTPVAQLLVRQTLTTILLYCVTSQYLCYLLHRKHSHN